MHATWKTQKHKNSELQDPLYVICSIDTFKIKWRQLSKIFIVYMKSDACRTARKYMNNVLGFWMWENFILDARRSSYEVMDTATNRKNKAENRRLFYAEVILMRTILLWVYSAFWCVCSHLNKPIPKIVKPRKATSKKNETAVSIVIEYGTSWIKSFELHT